MIRLGRNAALALVVAALSGCSYDYMNHLDTVSPRAGNAVKANLARETINPSKTSMTDTDGLGEDGNMPIVDVVVKDPLPGQN